MDIVKISKAIIFLKLTRSYFNNSVMFKAYFHQVNLNNDRYYKSITKR